MDYIKSPLHYIGGKYKLLPQILPLFPKKIDTFVDVFAGGGNVFANVDANHYICNDICKEVIQMLSFMRDLSYDYFVEYIHKIIDDFHLNSNNEKGYYILRDFYNKNKLYDSNTYLTENDQPFYLYTLICHSFNNQIRFNRKGEFNYAFGFRTFNENTDNELKAFINKLNSISQNIEMSSMDFEKLFKSLIIDDKMFFYCDPPYLITNAAYNSRGGWTEEKEYKLLDWLLTIHSKGAKFALSNVLTSNGRHNDILDEWIQNHPYLYIHHLNQDYTHCAYNKKVKEKDDEILVTNF